MNIKISFVVVMLFEDTKILDFIQYQKSCKTPYVIYEDLESLIKRIDGCNLRYGRFMV